MRPIVLLCALVLAALVGCGGEGDDDETAGGGDVPPIERCDWPMWGQGPDRSFSQPCDTTLSPATAPDLRRRWFFNTGDVVTASPAVVGDTVYVGDWAGTFYALARDDGTPRWTYRTDVHEEVYAGQIVSSAAVADVGGVRTVYFGAGKTLYALRAEDGELRWRHELGRPGDGTDPTEIESSPVVVDGSVIVGWDVHNSLAGEPAGVLALDAATGDERWVFDPEEGEPGGCGDVWGSATVDVDRGLVFAGSANCPRSPSGWGRYTEALFALDLRTGEPRWSYQPHEPNNDDLDFAGAPNLFEGADGTPLVGLGNKDAVYYAVERDTGALAWKTKVAEPGVTRPGSNFSTGGFTGGTARADGVIVGGTSIGGDPFLHALDAATGAIRWQQPVAAATYASAAEAGGVVFIGGTDFTFRALDLQTGEVLWSEEMTGVVAGGAAVVGDDVVAVGGIREPGLDDRSRTSGVTLFSLRGEPVASSSTTTAPVEAEPPPDPEAGVQPEPQPCVGTPCPVPFDLVRPPAGLTPSMTLLVQLDPWRVDVRAAGLGPPGAWLAPGSPAAQSGATAYALYLSERDDDPRGGLMCVLDETLACSGDAIPRPGATYNRLTLLAVDDATELPSLAEGATRLVATRSFDPPLRPVP